MTSNDDHYGSKGIFCLFATVILWAKIGSLNEKKPQQKTSQRTERFLCWQGRHDSNTQPAVLETAALPLSHSPLTTGSILSVGLHYVK